MPNFGSTSKRRDDPGRLGAEDEARGQDRVAADVVERAAARRLVADVVGVEQAIGEKGLDRAHFADRARARDLARTPPLRMMAHHERLGDELAGPRARGDQRLRLVGVERDRLLAQHVLAGLHRADRPRDVQLVGQRIVDRLDRRIGQQLLIGAIGAGDAERLGRRLRFREVARGDRVDMRDLAALHRREEPSRGRSWRRRARPTRLYASSHPPLRRRRRTIAIFPPRRNRRACRRARPRPIVGALA